MPLSSPRTSWSVSPTKAYAAVAAGAAGLALALACAAPAAAQEKPACEQFAWSVDREQALFGAPDLKTVPSGTTLTGQDRTVTLVLQPSAKVAYSLPPGRQPRSPDSYGGVISFADLPNGGTYQVTAPAEAWIDVIQNGKAIASVAHTGKRDCATIRKSVRFELAPGPVTIQVSGAPAPVIKIAILPAE